MIPRMFIGRRAELEVFAQLLRKPTASLVTCQGRRRVGKSRFIEECARGADHFLSFSGLPPRAGLSSADQRAAFADRLAAQTRAPVLPLPSWPAALQLLAAQLPATGTVVLLLDEVSWMGIGDPDFAGHLKTAWDQHFARRPGLVLVLCGSVSSWIEENILNSTGFVGRCSWQFRLEPLALPEAARFWGPAGERVAAVEKLRVLSVTGGIPKYLEEVDPALTAEKNIERLCFSAGGLLFNEFDQIFHDIFTRKADSYRNIVRALVAGPKSVDQISRFLRRSRGGSLGDALVELTQAGFIRREVIFDPETGTERPRDVRYRLTDNYLRFYLKYVERQRARIEKGLYQRVPLESLSAWNTVMGLQFENLLLTSLDTLLPRLGLAQVPVLNIGPYAQTAARRRAACQIDLLIRTRHALYVVEVKCRDRIHASVMDEVKEKIARLKPPAGLSVRTALVYVGTLDPALATAGYFDFLVSGADLLGDRAGPP